MEIKKIATRTGLLVASGLFAMGFQAQAGTVTESNQLDFEGLKAKCLELNGNQQLKPFKAIVTCRDVHYVWRQTSTKETRPLQNAREVGSTIHMKGFETPYVGKNVPTDPSQIQCIVMEKTQVSVPSVDSELSCDELNALEDLTDYCIQQVDQRVQDDPSLVIEEATGEIFNSCAGGSRIFESQGQESQGQESQGLK